MTNDFFAVIAESLVPDFPSLNLQEGPDSNEMRYMGIDVYHCFTQLGAGLEEVDKFVKKLKLVTEELDATLYTRVHISKQLHKETNLFVREVKGKLIRGYLTPNCIFPKLLIYWIITKPMDYYHVW